MTLLTFEPGLRSEWPPALVEDWRRRLRQQGIEWKALAYHKRPTLPATVYDTVIGAWTAWRLVAKQSIDILHARGHVPCCMAVLVKAVTRCRVIFDIRGFMPEESVDAGRWPPGGFLFRLAKLAERWLLRASDGFVVLTEKAREILFPGNTDSDALGRPFEVIPCCIDVERFKTRAQSRNEIRADLGVEGRRVIVYVGALGGWYMNEEMADFLGMAYAHDRATYVLILTQSPPALFEAGLRRRGLKDDDFRVLHVSPEDVPAWLEAADIALSFIKPCYSKLSSCPTKVAEYLMSGLPIVASAGIGDVDEVVGGDRVGVLVHDFTEDSYRAALTAVEALCREPEIAERCSASALSRFSLQTVGGPRYRRLYQRLMRNTRP